MKKSFPALTLVFAAILMLSGCFSSTKTEYIDEEKTSVTFESPKAESDFIAGMNRRKNLPGRFERPEERTTFSLVLVNVSRKKITSGPNRDYNQNARFCDSDKNGVISEKEAQAFLASAPVMPQRPDSAAAAETPARTN